jgi:hypothetical protein
MLLLKDESPVNKWVDTERRKRKATEARPVTIDVVVVVCHSWFRIIGYRFKYSYLRHLDQQRLEIESISSYKVWVSVSQEC